MRTIGKVKIRGGAKVRPIIYRTFLSGGRQASEKHGRCDIRSGTSRMAASRHRYSLQERAEAF